MAINPIPPKAVEKFIAGAPDAAKADKGTRTGKRVQMSLAMPSEVLDKVDTAAVRFNTSRAGYIKMTLSRAVEVDAP